jgi:hypothetical protein
MLLHRWIRSGWPSHVMRSLRKFRSGLALESIAKLYATPTHRSHPLHPHTHLLSPLQTLGAHSPKSRELHLRPACSLHAPLTQSHNLESQAMADDATGASAQDLALEGATDINALDQGKLPRARYSSQLRRSRMRHSWTFSSFVLCILKLRYLGNGRHVPCNIRRR